MQQSTQHQRNNPHVYLPNNPHSITATINVFTYPADSIGIVMVHKEWYPLLPFMMHSSVKCFKAFASFMTHFFFHFVWVELYVFLIYAITRAHLRVGDECVRDWPQDGDFGDQFEIAFSLSWTTFSMVGYGTVSLLGDTGDCMYDKPSSLELIKHDHTFGITLDALTQFACVIPIYFKTKHPSQRELSHSLAFC
jgi:hypothetical protein